MIERCHPSSARGWVMEGDTALCCPPEAGEETGGSGGNGGGTEEPGVSVLPLELKSSCLPQLPARFGWRTRTGRRPTAALVWGPSPPVRGVMEVAGGGEPGIPSGRRGKRQQSSLSELTAPQDPSSHMDHGPPAPRAGRKSGPAQSARGSHPSVPSSRWAEVTPQVGRAPFCASSRRVVTKIQVSCFS